MDPADIVIATKIKNYEVSIEELEDLYSQWFSPAIYTDPSELNTNYLNVINTTVLPTGVKRGEYYETNAQMYPPSGTNPDGPLTFVNPPLGPFGSDFDRFLEIVAFYKYIPLYAPQYAIDEWNASQNNNGASSSSSGRRPRPAQVELWQENNLITFNVKGKKYLGD